MADTCRSCKAPILWVTMPSDKKMPVDAQPHPEGNVEVTGKGYGTVLTKEYAEKARAAWIPLYRPHLPACPSAAAHRKKGA